MQKPTTGTPKPQGQSSEQKKKKPFGGLKSKPIEKVGLFASSSR